MDQIIATIKGLFTPAQWQKLVGWLTDTGIVILDNGLLVLLTVALIIACTQIVKTSWRLSKKVRGPSDIWVHVTSLFFAAVWPALLFMQSSIGEKAAISVLSWFGSWVLATFGGRALAEYAPRFWSIWQRDRRHAQIRNAPQRRSDDK